MGVGGIKGSVLITGMGNGYVTACVTKWYYMAARARSILKHGMPLRVETVYRYGNGHQSQNEWFRGELAEGKTSESYFEPGLITCQD